MTTDYLDFTFYKMPTKARRKLDVGDIFINMIQCRSCGWIIRSKNRHDFVYCKCQKVGIDGGSWYQRIIARSKKDYYNHVVYFRYISKKYDNI